MSTRRTAEIIPLREASRALADRDDDALMLLSSSGRRDAFRVLIERHGARVFRFCFRMTGDRAVAEELAQETWIAAWNTRVSYEPRGQFATWLFVAARNRGLNAKRGDARRARVMAHDPDDVAVAKTASDDPSQLDRLIVAEEHARVDQALTELPPAMREAVTLRYAEVLAYEEIGAITGATPSTVRSRVFHGVKKLHAILTGTEEGGSP